jgi:Kae1-associated kinase Bud32
VNSSTIIAHCAESIIYRTSWHDHDVCVKYRIPKKYRETSLDDQLRQARTVQEAKLIARANEAGLNTPFIREIDLTNFIIVMDWVSGKPLKDYFFDHLSLEAKQLLFQLGVTMGSLHRLGIIHGDLTSSNCIVSNYDLSPWLIDFGLGKFSVSVEDQAVDLLVFKKTLKSTHVIIAEEAWNIFIEAYSHPKKEEILNRINTIEQRVRHSKGLN